MLATPETPAETSFAVQAGGSMQHALDQRDQPLCGQAVLLAPPRDMGVLDTPPLCADCSARLLHLRRPWER